MKGQLSIHNVEAFQPYDIVRGISTIRIIVGSRLAMGMIVSFGDKQSP